VLNQPSHHEDLWRMEMYLHTFLTSALDGGEWSVSRLGRLPPGK